MGGRVGGLGRGSRRCELQVRKRREVATLRNNMKFSWRGIEPGTAANVRMRNSHTFQCPLSENLNKLYSTP